MEASPGCCGVSGAPAVDGAAVVAVVAGVSAYAVEMKFMVSPLFPVFFYRTLGGIRQNASRLLLLSFDA